VAHNPRPPRCKLDVLSLQLSSSVRHWRGASQTGPSRTNRASCWGAAARQLAAGRPARESRQIGGATIGGKTRRSSYTEACSSGEKSWSKVGPIFALSQMSRQPRAPSGGPGQKVDLWRGSFMRAARSRLRACRRRARETQLAPLICRDEHPGSTRRTHFSPTKQ